jgi:undecaprenyl-diphosphatase
MENSYPLPRVTRRPARARIARPPRGFGALDLAIRNYCLEDPGPIAKAVKIAGRYGIKRHVLIPGFALCWVAGHKADLPELERAGKIGLIGVVATALVAEVIKRNLCRARPCDCGDSAEWGTVGARSFPSGHAGSAFAAATAIACVVEDRRVGAGALVAAGVLAGGRVIADRHWASDVLAGAVLGTAVTALGAWWITRKDIGG